jgi:GAF domain-containing protein
MEPGSFGGTFDDYQRDVHPEDRDRVRAAIRSTIAGEPHDLTYRIILPDGEIRWLNARGQLLRAADGAPARLIGVCADVTDARRREQASGLLTEISTALGESLDYEETLASLARMVVPVLGDFCIIDLLDPITGVIRRVASAQADASFEPMLAELREFSPDPASDGLVARALRTGVPQLVTRLADPSVEAATSANSRHAEILRALAPESVMCVPMVARGLTIGTMLLIAAGSRRRYGAADLDFAAEVERRAALAVDNARLHHDALAAREAAQAQAREIQSILSSISEPFVVHDREWLFRYVNEAARAVFRNSGHPDVADGLLGVVVWDAYPELRGTQFELTMRRARDTGVPVTFEELYPERGTWSEMRCYPLPDGGLATSWRDITERKRVEEADQYLSSATAILASSLEYQQTLNALAQLVVPRLADWCAVDLLAPDGSIRRVATAHADPDRIKWGHEMNERYPTDPAETSGVAQVIRSGHPEFARDITDEMLAASISDPEYLHLLQSIGMRSAIVVPLSVQGRTLGALSLVAAESGRRYDDADLQLAGELARRAAFAVENSRLHESALVAQREAAAEAAHAEQFRRVQELSPEPFALFAVIRGADDRVVDFEWVWANPAALVVQATDLDTLCGQRLLSRNPGVASTPLFEGYVRAAETEAAYEDEVHYRNEWIDT